MLLLQKHIEMGQEHLKSLLSQEGVEELCSLDSMSPQTEDKVEPSSIELGGAFTLSFNSTLIAILGAWSGLLGFMGVSFTPRLVYEMGIPVCVTIGLLIGLLSYRFNKKEIQKRMDERKLQDIQISILDFLNHKRSQQRENTKKEIAVLLETIGISEEEGISYLARKDFNSNKLCLKWLSQIEESIEEKREEKNPQVCAVFIEEIEEMKKAFQSHRKKRSPPLGSDEGPLSILQSLIQRRLPEGKRKKSWIRTNWKTLLIEGLPLLYGSLSSLFFYLSRAQQITEELGAIKLYSFVSLPQVKAAQVMASVAITLYFLFSFFNKNWRKFRRDQEIQQTQEILLKKEETLLELDHSLLKVKEVLAFLQRVTSIRRVWDKI